MSLLVFYNYLSLHDFNFIHAIVCSFNVSKSTSKIYGSNCNDFYHSMNVFLICFLIVQKNDKLGISKLESNPVKFNKLGLLAR